LTAFPAALPTARATLTSVVSFFFPKTIGGPSRVHDAPGRGRLASVQGERTDPDSPTVHGRGGMADAAPALPGWTFPVDDIFE
jgi:hypothetical protein